MPQVAHPPTHSARDLLDPETRDSTLCEALNRNHYLGGSDRKDFVVTDVVVAPQHNGDPLYVVVYARRQEKQPADSPLNPSTADLPTEPLPLGPTRVRGEAIPTQLNLRGSR